MFLSLVPSIRERRLLRPFDFSPSFQRDKHGLSRSAIASTSTYYIQPFPVYLSHRL
ncbi:hypothetical protein CSUI_011267 [Cystoisospora suis]|uniref:Uncharacterized protein n=1 Tax=Cystoisospora suis TaxID=483139 RepID=A0A2C6KEE5_9APIC|nr:hypothetical protein CSUI_011267 [Cystoisospora suis]